MWWWMEEQEPVSPLDVDQQFAEDDKQINSRYWIGVLELFLELMHEKEKAELSGR